MRSAQRQRQNHCRYLGARAFLERAVGVGLSADTAADFVDLLKDGVLLCNCVKRLTGDSSWGASNITPLGEHRQKLENFTR